MNHLKPHEIEGARLHGAPKLYWVAAVKDGTSRLHNTRCGRYSVVESQGNGRGPLFAVHYLVLLPQRHVMHIERSLDAALSKVQAHHAARCISEIAGLAERSGGVQQGRSRSGFDLRSPLHSSTGSR